MSRKLSGTLIAVLLTWIAGNVGAATDLRRSQEPKQPYPYRSEDVIFSGPLPGTKLAGTLTLPAGPGPFPAALLVNGSGLQDRDGSVLGHKPFQVLAHHLTRRGIAVLRVDDRGIGGSPGPSAVDTAESARDARAAIEYLQRRPEIDSTRIGVVGHSEGGIIAAMLAASSPDLAYIVLMAGPGVSGEELLLQQGALVSKAGGASEETIALQRDVQKQMFAILRQNKDDPTTRRELLAVWADARKRMSAAELEAMGEPDAVIRRQIRAVMSQWFRFFLAYDPREALEQVRCPVLAIDGELDLQVPAKQNLPAIASALSTARNEDFTIRELPGLNHMLQRATTGAPSEYALIEETLSPVALQVIGDWVVARTAGQPAVAKRS